MDSNCYSSLSLKMDGLVPYANGFFYGLPTITAPLNTWHPHIYNKPVKKPTPFFISNILDLKSSARESEIRSQIKHQFTTQANQLNIPQRLCNTSGVIKYDADQSPSPSRYSDRAPTRPTNGQSPCSFMRDRVDSPEAGKS